MEPGQLKEWTGWGNTDAKNNAPCPRCAAQPGEPCRTPSGKKYGDVHGARLGEFRRLFPKYNANERPKRSVQSVLNRFESQIPGFIKRQ